MTFGNCYKPRTAGWLLLSLGRQGLAPGLTAPLLTRFIHELFEILDNLLKYNSKFNNPEKQSVFCTGWKACATMFFAVWRIIRPKLTRCPGG